MTASLTAAISDRGYMTRGASSVWNGEARTWLSTRTWLLAIRRFLSLWLPRLATDRARRLSSVDRAAPLAAVAKVNNAQRLVCVDAEAARLGLTVGLPLADARARHPSLVAVRRRRRKRRGFLSASATGAPA